MRKIFTLLVFSIFSFALNAQNTYFKSISPAKSQFCPFKDSVNACQNLKAIFIYDNAKLLINKGVPEFDKKVKTGQVVDVIGFSELGYKETEKQDTKLPYVKIKLDNQIFWTYSRNLFIFQSTKPATKVESQGIVYNFYLARCPAYSENLFDNQIFSGIELLIGENTKSNSFFLIKYDKYPKELSGHEIGIKYVYLQNDEMLAEKITGYSTEKHFIVLKIKAAYQEKTANYQIIIFPTYNPVKANFSSISYE